LGILRQALASHEWEKTALAPPFDKLRASLKKGGISKATPLAWLPGNPSNAVAPLFKGVGGSECVSPDTNSINDCNTSLGKDAIHCISTDGLFVTFFFQIGIK
jgi:hypothetical protein